MNPTDDDMTTLMVPMYGESLSRGVDDMTLVRDERDHLNTRPAPRVPRQTEPAPLWWVLAMVVFVGTFLGLLLGCGAHAAVASFEMVVGWLRGVLP